MTKREEYEARTEKLLEPIMEENNFELVDVEYVKEAGNWYLRAYIDKEGGITLNDCEYVNRTLSDIMDREDFIPDAYILEVSSPGLGRQLKKDKDFRRSIGENFGLKKQKTTTALSLKSFVCPIRRRSQVLWRNEKSTNEKNDCEIVRQKRL